MKILHMNDERWDSGISAYSLQVVKLLTDAGHDVVFGCAPGSKPHKSAVAQGVATIPVNSFFSARKAVLSQKWDIVNPHTGRCHTWSVVIKKLHPRRGQAPIVRTRGDAREVPTNPLAKFILKNTTAIIAASDHIRRQYEIGFGIDDEAARTIYPSIKSDDQISAPPHHIVGILGRLDPVKGHTFLIEAAVHVLKDLPGVKFLVAGKEANVTVSLLENHAEQLGIKEAFQFLGYQDSSLEFMRGCSLGVIASIGSEEVSRACLEWMSVGRPVIGTTVGCLPELIEPGETGDLVPPEDSAALAGAILKLLKDPEGVSKWGQVGHSLIQRRFSEKIQLEKTLGIYKWAIQNKQSRKELN